MSNQTVIKTPKYNTTKLIIIFTFIILIAEFYLFAQKLGPEHFCKAIGECMVYSIIATILFPYRWLKNSKMLIIVPVTICFTIICSYKMSTVNILDQDTKKFVSGLKTIIIEDKTLDNKQLEDMNLGFMSDMLKILNDHKAKILDIYSKYSQFVESRLENAFDVNVLTDNK